MLGGPRRVSGESGAWIPALGRMNSGLVRVGEGGAGNMGSGLSSICGVNERSMGERSMGPSQETTLVVATRAWLESYMAAMGE